MTGLKKDKYTVSPIHLFSVVYVSIVDVGMMGFQRDVVANAGSDGWITVIAVGISVHLLLWMMFVILSRQEAGGANIVSVNLDCFGKYIGMLLNAAFVLFLVLGAFSTYRTYLEICKVWIFPTMNLWPFGLLLLFLVYYTVSGGFQTVAGVCLWGMMSVLLFIAPLVVLLTPRLHTQNLLPAFDHSAMELLQSSGHMAFQYIGFEVLLVAYPFIRRPDHSRKWAHASVLLATVMYMIMLLVATMYFSYGQIYHTIWPTLNVISMLELPLMQRLEYIVLSIWLIKILANISLSLWAACHSAKLAFRIRPRIGLLICLALLLALQWYAKDLDEIARFTRLYDQVGLWLLYAFVPLLFIVNFVRHKPNGHLNRLRPE